MIFWIGRLLLAIQSMVAKDGPHFYALQTDASQFWPS